MMAPAAPPATAELLTFQVHGQRFALEVARVREIRSRTPITPLPHATRDLLGVVDLRGLALPVYDLALRLRGQAAAASAPVMIVVQSSTGMSGLLVEDVCDIVSPDPSAYQPPAVIVPGAAGGVQAYLDLPDGLTFLLNLDEVLPVRAAA